MAGRYRVEMAPVEIRRLNATAARDAKARAAAIDARAQLASAIAEANKTYSLRAIAEVVDLGVTTIHTLIREAR